ncbi:DUF2066 domain-containing protein [Marinomonas sp.]
MKIRIFLFLVCVLSGSIANAVTVQGLYRADIKVPAIESESAMLNSAFSQAVKQVLIKVSGNEQAIRGNLLVQAQKSAASWVAQHSVVALPDLLSTESGLVPGRQVMVTFYRESIDGFLSQNNLPVWAENRPSVLVWLVNDDGASRQVSGANAPSVELNEFALAMTRKGVPVYAPLMDSVDQSEISAADIWGFFTDSIQQASRRYQTDVVAALRLSRFGESASGDLLLLLPSGDTQRFSIAGDDLNALLDTGAGHLAKALSDRYAAVRSRESSARFVLEVLGVSDFKQMDKVQAYLQSVGVVREVQLQHVKANQVAFSVDVDGGKDKLLSAIGLSRVLVPTQPPVLTEPTQESPNTQYFQFNGE